jgi:hypothetical protein
MIRIICTLLLALAIQGLTPYASAQGLGPNQACVLNNLDCTTDGEDRLIDQPSFIEVPIDLIETQPSLLDNEVRLIDQDPCVLATLACVSPDAPRLIDTQPDLIDNQPRLIDDSIPCVLASLQCTSLEDPTLLQQSQPCVLATAQCTALPEPADPVNLAGAFAGTWTGSYSGPYRSNLARCQGTATGNLRIVLNQPGPTAQVTGSLSYTGSVTCGGNTSVDTCPNSPIGPIAVVNSRIQFPNNCDQSTVTLLVDSPNALSGSDTFSDGDESWETRITVSRS